MANGHCFAQGRALAVFPEGNEGCLTPQRTSRIADKNLTRDPENAWALHPLLLASFLRLGGCTSELNLPVHFRVELTKTLKYCLTSYDKIISLCFIFVLLQGGAVW